MPYFLRQKKLFDILQCRQLGIKMAQNKINNFTQYDQRNDKCYEKSCGRNLYWNGAFWWSWVPRKKIKTTKQINYKGVYFQILFKHYCEEDILTLKIRNFLNYSIPASQKTIHIHFLCNTWNQWKNIPSYFEFKNLISEFK